MRAYLVSKAYRPKSPTFALMILLGIASFCAPHESPAASNPAPSILLDIDASEEPSVLPQPSNVKRLAPAAISFPALQSALDRQTNRLRLNLFKDVDEIIEVTSISKTTDNQYTLLGPLASGGGGYAALSVSQDAFMASVRRGDGSLFRVRGAGSGAHIVEELDDSIFPPCHGSIAPPAKLLPAPPSETSALADDGSLIDVLVVYTPLARSVAGNQDDMEALINLAVTEANLIYTNSAITPRIRLVHSMEVDYEESGEHSTDLTRLSGTADGFMDDVHAARDLYGADLVQLIIQDPDSCGLAYQMTTRDAGFATSAFSVVHIDCATGVYYFAHELAHNMGCEHAVGDSGQQGTVAQGDGVDNFSHGWRWVDDFFQENRSIMAMPTGVLRPYISNPNVIHLGAPTGQALGESNEAYNAKTVNDSANLVANFRQETSVLTVTPIARLNSAGGNGNPFVPAGREYTLTNSGSAEIEWTATVDQAWVTLSKSGDTVPGEGTDSLTATINAAADALPGPAKYLATITITDVTNTIVYEREIELRVVGIFTPPFFDGFDEGHLDNWIVNAGGSGNTPFVSPTITLLGGHTPRSGSWVCYLGDSTDANTAVSTIDLLMDLTGTTQPRLDFWWIAASLTPPNEWIQVDIFDGTWHENVNSWRYSNDEWQQRFLDLNAFNKTANFIIRFKSQMDFTSSSDAAYLDSVNVIDITPTPTPTATSTPTQTPPPTATPTPTPDLTPTPSPTPTPDETPTPTPTPDVTPSPTPDITPTPDASPTPRPDGVIVY